jgi:CO/xanthine dehydrogenase Mo-binding subunit
VRLNADGSAVLLTSSVEIGQGTPTSLAQIVAEELGISAERVSVTFPDTDVTPFDQSTSSSRTIFTMGSAARQAAQQIREQLLEIGSRVLEAHVDDLEIREGALQVRGAPSSDERSGCYFRRTTERGLAWQGATTATRGGVDPKTGKGKAWHFFYRAARKWKWTPRRW